MPRNTKAWTASDDASLLSMYEQRLTHSAMATALGRTLPSVSHRLQRVGLEGYRQKSNTFENIDVYDDAYRIGYICGLFATDGCLDKADRKSVV